MGEFLGQYADYPTGDIVNYSAYSHQFGVDHWNDYNGSLVKVGDSIYFDNVLSVSGDTPPGFTLTSNVFGTSCTTPGVYNFVLYLLNGTNVPWRLVVYSGSFTETYHNYTISTGVPISVSTLDVGYHDVWIFSEPPNYLFGPPSSRVLVPQGITYNSDTAIFYGTPTMAYHLVLYMIIVKLDAGFNCIYEHVSFTVNISPGISVPSVNICSVGGIFMPNTLSGLLNGPYQIDGGEWDINNSPFMGPFANGTDLYTIFSESGGYIDTIYKSTDGGVNWDALLVLSPPDNYDSWFACQKGVTSHIALLGYVYSGSTGRNKLYDFDMANDTLTLVDDSWIVSYTHGYYDVARWFHYNSITDEYQVIYWGRDTDPSLADPGHDLYVRQYRSSWQAGQKLAVCPNTSNVWYYSLCDDIDGITHAFVATYGDPTTNSIIYVQIAADGSVGSTTVIKTAPDFQAIGRASIINEKVILPIFDANVGGVFLVGPSFDEVISSVSAYGIGAVSNNQMGHTPGTSGRLWWIEGSDDAPNVLKSCTFDGTTIGAIETIYSSLVGSSLYSFGLGSPALTSATRIGFGATFYDLDSVWDTRYFYWDFPHIVNTCTII